MAKKKRLGTGSAIGALNDVPAPANIPVQLEGKLIMPEQPADSITVNKISYDGGALIDPKVWEKLIGSTGTLMLAGYLSEEHIAELQREGWAYKADEMVRSDEIIAALIQAFKAPILSAVWDFEAGVHNDKVAEQAVKLCKENFFERMSRTWTELLDEIFEGLLKSGYCLQRPQTAIIENSYALDGKKAWFYKNFAFINPKTIWRWRINPETEDLEEVYQLAPFNDRPFVGWINADNLFHIALNQQGTNFEGRSPFRSAYGNYYRKKLAQKVKMIAIERAGLGFPVVTYPKDWKENSTEFLTLKAIAENITSHNKAFIMVPEGVKIDFAEIPAKIAEIEASIQEENRCMTYVILADYLMVGTQGTGSRAANQDKTKNFLSTLNFFAWHFIEKFQKYVKQLCLWNIPNIKDEQIPKLTVSGIERKALEAFGTLISLLATSQVITPDANLEEFIRNMLDMPQKLAADAETRSEAVQGKDGLSQDKGAPTGPAGPQNKAGEGKKPNLNDNGIDEAELPRSEEQPRAPVGVDIPDESGQIREPLAERHIGQISKLADIPASGPLKYWRPLTKYEQKTNFADLQRSLIGYKNDFNFVLKNRLSQTVEAWIKELRKRVLKDGGNIRNVLENMAEQKPNVTPLTTDLTDEIKKVALAGQKSMESEIKAKAKFAVEPEKLSAGAYAWVKQEAGRIATSKTSALVDRMRGAAAIAASSYPLNSDTTDAQDNIIIAAAQAAGIDFITNENNLDGGYEVPLALNMGRSDACEGNGDVIGFQYSAILDDLNCGGICEELDGATRAADDSASAQFDPPEHINCRCILIPITAAEGEPPDGFTGFHPKSESQFSNKKEKAAAK